MMAKEKLTQEPLTTSTLSLMGEVAQVPVKNTVTFIAEYAKDFKGDKPMMDGSVHEVDKSVGDLFVSKGFGKIV
jgi:hypothetical protein